MPAESRTGETQTLSGHFRGHFGHRRHLYGVLLDKLADDLDAGGPTADICRDHLGASRADAVQLRLLAGIFRIVLSGQAPELKPFYTCLGGTADPEGAWPVLRPVLAGRAEQLRAALDQAPQTNEAGRSACLALGLFAAVRRHGLSRVRLLELGASAGLNLNVDRFTFAGPGWRWGPADSPLVLDTAASGVRPEKLTLVERRGCDLSPVDAAAPDGAAYLTSFVWPFDLVRHQRLTAALDVVRRHPVTVDRASAGEWLGEQLSREVPADVLTVVWHSITEQYWPASETASVHEAIDAARERMPLAHISMEGVPPQQGGGGYSIREHGPVTRVDGVAIARSHHHGPPVIIV